MVKYTKTDRAQLQTFKDQYKAQELILKSQQKLVSKTEEKLRGLSETISDLSRITEFYEDEYAINIRVSDSIYGKGSDTFLESVPDNGRTADVYINANSRKTWGCILRGHSLGILGDKYLGSHFTKEEALRLAKEWVAKGNAGE
jgi:hypothetical protein